MSSSSEQPDIDNSRVRVAIMCALTKEMEPFDLLNTIDKGLLNGNGKFDKIASVSRNDPNIYVIRHIGKHDVALLTLAKMGSISSAVDSVHLKSTFPNLDLVLLVGICGGLPTINKKSAFLGDVIISKDIVKYDLVAKQYKSGVVYNVEDDPVPGASDAFLSKLMKHLNNENNLNQLRTAAAANLDHLQKNSRHEKFCPPPAEEDGLYDPTYEHKHRRMCDECEANLFCEDATTTKCEQIGCDKKLFKPRSPDRTVERPESQGPYIWMGKIASGNAVMKSAIHRDAIAEKHDVIGFEMEGAGVEVPCLVIKGICDYADSHKNKQCQDYAAATAASVAVALMNFIPALEKLMPPPSDEQVTGGSGGGIHNSGKNSGNTYGNNSGNKYANKYGNNSGNTNTYGNNSGNTYGNNSGVFNSGNNSGVMFGNTTITGGGTQNIARDVYGVQSGTNNARDQHFGRG